MNDLEKLKEPYMSLVSNINISDYSMLEVADKYTKETDKLQKDVYTSMLIIYCWPALEKLYYNQNVKLLSLTDCYDIFMDSFFYVMDKKVWKNPNNILYNDKDAILKAMYVLVESRRKNYFVSQNRQKRIVNQYPMSLDSLSKDFQDGYFSSITEKYNFDRGWEEKFINSLWQEKRYIAAIVFDIIITFNVFEDNKLNIKKIKKYLKHLSRDYYSDFLKRYDIIDAELGVYDRYISNIDEGLIYNYIHTALSSFREEISLQKVRENNVD